MNTNLALFENLPVYQEDLEKIRAKKKSINCLQEMLLELMEERSVSLARIHKETGIPFSTLMDWHNGESKSQMLEENILKLARYFNVSLEYLCFGIGSDEEAYGKLGS